MTRSVYFDNNATTAVAPEAVEAMLPYLREHYGNPSSPHGFARKPAMIIAASREQVASLLGAAPPNIVFTSGGTEGNAMAINAALAARPHRREIIMSAVEHAAVWGWKKRLVAHGYTIHVAGVDREGALDIDGLRARLSDQTALVCLMRANNETGIIYPVHEVAESAHAAGALVLTDAVQAAGKIPLDVQALGADYVLIGGHKFHAAKGVGALYVRDAKNFTAMMAGGEQEAGMRPGTEAVPAIASLGAAAKLAQLIPDGMSVRRDAFESWLEAHVSGVIILGRHQPRLPNTTLALFPDIETEPLLALLDMHGVACSSGSACASGAHEPSHVIAAMGFGQQTVAILRVSASRYTTDDDYERLRDALTRALAILRAAK